MLITYIIAVSFIGGGNWSAQRKPCLFSYEDLNIVMAIRPFLEELSTSWTFQ
jgi:hypothetical protein